MSGLIYCEFSINFSIPQKPYVGFIVVLVTLPDVFENTYHERVGIAGLNYLALGLGLSGASQVSHYEIS